MEEKKELSELEFINQKMGEYSLLIGQLQPRMNQINHEINRAIEDIQREAGIQDRIKELEDRRTLEQKALQSKADNLQGRMAILTELKKEFHKPDYSHLIPEGVTHMHGIELAKHKHKLETLSRIIRGEEDTIAVLGGSLDPDPDMEVVFASSPEVKAEAAEKVEDDEDEDLLDLLS